MTDEQGSIALKKAARLPAAVAVLVGAVVFYGALNLIESVIPFGFDTEYRLSESDYTTKNDIFESYTSNVNIVLDYCSKTTTINTPAVTVSELLEGQGIYVDENDSVSVPLDALVTEAMTISVDKIDEYTIELTETKQYETIIHELQTIPYGSTELVQAGNNGVTLKKIKQVYENGELASETVVSTEVIEPLVNEVENLGVGGTYVASNGKRYNYSYYIDVLATAYGGETFSGSTYTGKQVEVGMIAVDPDYIPLGASVYLVNEEGDLDFGVCYAEDTGSLIIGERIDIYMGPDEAAVEAATAFGRKNMRVYILR